MAIVVALRNRKGKIALEAAQSITLEYLPTPRAVRILNDSNETITVRNIAVGQRLLLLEPAVLKGRAESADVPLPPGASDDEGDRAVVTWVDLRLWLWQRRCGEAPVLLSKK
ncbi:MAG: hypothetical protein M3Y77_17355 [Actinomycetota bacterium]|nr:hypothetical protein [Actinomycetota bacterium]